jgi:PncC family amidohydrolase
MSSHDLSLVAARAGEVAGLALASGTTICTAESCTGGLIAHLPTATPGISAVYQGGVVPYSNHAKVDLLGVDAALLERRGAVSEEVARAMALGAAARLRARLAVATTGIAGPGGGSEAKAVGLVYIAVGGEGAADCRRFQFVGDRQAVIVQAAGEALSMLGRAIRSQAP